MNLWLCMDFDSLERHIVANASDYEGSSLPSDRPLEILGQHPIRELDRVAAHAARRMAARDDDVNVTSEPRLAQRWSFNSSRSHCNDSNRLLALAVGLRFGRWG